MRLLLTGGGGPAASNFLDALRLDGGPDHVVAVDTSPYHLELLEADARYLVPPVTDPGYLEALVRVIEREHIDVVHPQPDPEVRFLAQVADTLPARTFLPPGDVVVLAQDKLASQRAMANAGVAVPRSFGVDDIDGLRHGVRTLTVGGRRAWLRAVRGAGARASLPVATAEQAVSWVDYWEGFAGLTPQDFMVSEMLEGQEYAWQSLWWEGRLITSQARCRVAYLFGNVSPSGQTSTPSVAVTANRPDVDEAGMGAVRALAPVPHGVFCVDMKCDDADVPRVTEVNAGRFFTTSNFFAHAGLNMPELYLRLAMGATAPTDLPATAPLPEGLWWIRNPDMGYVLVKDAVWRSTPA
jgi:hypothetical protein